MAFSLQNSKRVVYSQSSLIPAAVSPRFTLAEKMANGLNKHETSIGMMHHTESLLRGNIATARQADESHKTAKSVKLAATKDVQTADKAGRKFISAAREVLKPKLGDLWSQTWEQAGFVNGSYGVPRKRDARVEVIRRLADYFDANPMHENGPLGITSAAAESLHGGLTAAVATVDGAKASIQTQKQPRADALKALNKRMRGVVGELSDLIDENDGRWLDFGLHLPGTIQAPEVVMGVQVQGAGTGHLLASWQPSTRADRYRVRKQVVGVNADFVDAVTVTELNANLNTFPSGAQVRLKVTALNEAGEGPESDVVEAVAP
ncbi:MAG: fibronectin type III domain-containing protein [Verrucomicrobia bacterium]|nr:fibronectin type III domain-containing protein [Verrucomicrobiota bacterium]